MDIISVIALGVSLISVTWTIWYTNRQRKLQPMFNYLAQIAGIEKNLGENQDLLKCHSIEPSELKEIGVTPEEFGYLLSSFTIGHAWYLAHGYGKSKKNAFEKGSYRYQMITSTPAIKSWPILKKFISDTRYRDKLEATIKEYERTAELAKK